MRKERNIEAQGGRSKTAAARVWRKEKNMKMQHVLEYLMIPRRTHAFEEPSKDGKK